MTTVELIAKKSQYLDSYYIEYYECAMCKTITAHAHDVKFECEKKYPDDVHWPRCSQMPGPEHLFKGHLLVYNINYVSGETEFRPGVKIVYTKKGSGLDKFYE